MWNEYTYGAYDDTDVDSSDWSFFEARFTGPN